MLFINRTPSQHIVKLRLGNKRESLHDLGSSLPFWSWWDYDHCSPTPNSTQIYTKIIIFLLIRVIVTISVLWILCFCSFFYQISIKLIWNPRTYKLFWFNLLNLHALGNVLFASLLISEKFRILILMEMQKNEKIDFHLSIISQKGQTSNM